MELNVGVGRTDRFGHHTIGHIVSFDLLPSSARLGLVHALTKILGGQWSPHQMDLCFAAIYVLLVRFLSILAFIFRFAGLAVAGSRNEVWGVSQI